MTTIPKHTIGAETPTPSHSQDQAARLEKCASDARHEEEQLDRAVENTFPASDPVAELPAAATSAKIVDSEDAQLDEAIEMTFPASDPVTVSNITKVVPESDKAAIDK